MKVYVTATFYEDGTNLGATFHKSLVKAKAKKALETLSMTETVMVHPQDIPISAEGLKRAFGLGQFVSSATKEELIEFNYKCAEEEESND